MSAPRSQPIRVLVVDDSAFARKVLRESLATSPLIEVIGTARLLPTNCPYLLGDVFLQLMNGLPVPDSSEIWELSRFAAVDFNAATTSALVQFSSPTAVGLLRASLKHAASLGAKRLITVSPLGIERLLRKARFLVHRAGPPMLMDGHPILACWIDVSGF